MDKVLRPERFCTDPRSVGAPNSWIHWRWTFQNFLAVLTQEGLDKFGVLTNFISPMVFEYVEECADYESVIATLHNIYVKPTNEIYARHQLATSEVKAWTSTYRLLKFSARNATSNLSRLPSIARNTSGTPSSLEYILTKSVRGCWKTKPWI